MRLLFVVIFRDDALLLAVLGPKRTMSRYSHFALQQVLSTLKQSVEKLSLDNDQLSARDNAIKQQVLALQTQLDQLEAQGDVLNKAADKLQDNNPRRAQQIARLEEENSNLDDQYQKAQSDVKLIQQSLDARVSGRSTIAFAVKRNAECLANVFFRSDPGFSQPIVKKKN